MELLQFAHEEKLEVLRLALRRELGAIVLVDGLPAVASGLEREMLSTVSSQAATVFALVAAREQSHRGSMKDPRSSAYTFAYFVDVAGRERGTDGSQRWLRQQAHQLREPAARRQPDVHLRVPGLRRVASGNAHGDLRGAGHQRAAHRLGPWGIGHREP